MGLIASERSEDYYNSNNLQWRAVTIIVTTRLPKQNIRVPVIIYVQYGFVGWIPTISALLCILLHLNKEL